MWDRWRSWLERLVEVSVRALYAWAAVAAALHLIGVDSDGAAYAAGVVALALVACVYAVCDAARWTVPRRRRRRR